MGRQQTRIIFWRVGPLSHRLPLLGEWSRNPSALVHQLALLWEAAFSFSELFSEDSFNAFAHLMTGDLRAHPPTPHWVFSSFWPKPVWTPCPILPIHPISPRMPFFVSLDEKFLKGNPFANVEEVTQKTAESLKDIKINEFKNCFERWK